MGSVRAGATVVDLPPPRRLWVTLQEAGGPPARVLAGPGRQVAAGEILARVERSGGGPQIHSPLAATVVGVTQIDTAHGLDVPAVELLVSRDAAGTANPAGTSPRALDGLGPAGLADLADRAGLIDRHSGQSLSELLRSATAAQVRFVIVSGLDPEPMLSAISRLAATQPTELVAAASGVQQALSARRLWLVVNKSDVEAARRFRAAARGTSVRIAPLWNKYPQAHPNLLVRAVTGREVRPGAGSLSAGVLVLDLLSLSELAAAARGGNPHTHCVVMVSGAAADRPGLYRVPIGTSYEHLIRQVGLRRHLGRVVDGGPMTGRSISSAAAVISKRTMSVLLLAGDDLQPPAPGPCIRCGWCQEHCPVGLDPMSLLAVREREAWAEAAALYPAACIGCGVCSYVCPAELPLAEAVRTVASYRSPASNNQ